MPAKQGHPQLEDGHTRIANELLEALMRYPFQGGELKVILAVVRLTYGWQRRHRAIRQKALARMTGVSARQVRRLLAGLRQQGVLFRDRTTCPHTFQLNKVYAGWRDWPQGSAASSQADTRVPSAGDTGVPPLKEKKERDLKESAPAPAVQNLLVQFIRLLKRPLSQDEHDLVAYLAELPPDQAQLLLAQVAQKTGEIDKPSGSLNGSSGSVEEAV